MDFFLIFVQKTLLSIAQWRLEGLSWEEIEFAFEIFTNLQQHRCTRWALWESRQSKKLPSLTANEAAFDESDSLMMFALEHCGKNTFNFSQKTLQQKHLLMNTSFHLGTGESNKDPLSFSLAADGGVIFGQCSSFKVECLNRPDESQLSSIISQVEKLAPFICEFLGLL